MQDFDAVGHHCVFWKVSQIAVNDHVTASGDCRSEDMTVVGIGKIERRDQRFVSGDQTVPRGRSMRRRVCSRVARSRFVADQGVGPLPMDVFGSFGAKDIVSRHLQKNIPHLRGIENVGIKKSGEARHWAPYPMS